MYGNNPRIGDNEGIRHKDHRETHHRTLGVHQDFHTSVGTNVYHNFVRPSGWGMHPRPGPTQRIHTRTRTHTHTQYRRASETMHQAGFTRVTRVLMLSRLLE